MAISTEHLKIFRDELIMSIVALNFRDSEVAEIMNLDKSTVGRIIKKERSNYQYTNHIKIMKTKAKAKAPAKKVVAKKKK